jgi:hypothetical protein
LSLLTALLKCRQQAHLLHVEHVDMPSCRRYGEADWSEVLVGGSRYL